MEKYCEFASKTTHQLNKVTTTRMDDDQFNKEENESVGELSTVCSQMSSNVCIWIVLGRPDISWSVNRLARAVTKWTKSCGKRFGLTRNQHHKSIGACSEVKRLCQGVGCARNRFQFHTVLQKLKSFLSMQVYA